MIPGNSKTVYRNCNYIKTQSFMTVCEKQQPKLVSYDYSCKTRYDPPFYNGMNAKEKIFLTRGNTF